MDSYVCDYCSKNYKSKTTITRHVFQAHNPDGICQTFECDYCSKKFPTKYSIQRHIKQLHLSGNSRTLDCSICYKSYSRPDLLQRHILLYHGSNQKSKLLECVHCKLTFATSKLRIEHIRRYHPDVMQRAVSKVTRLKCLKCGDLFLKRSELNDHYRLQHDVKLIFDKLEFSSMQNFEEWLESMKRRTITHFVIHHRYKTASTSNLQLMCHRSRGYADMPKKDERKRHLKINGYKGLDGYCPSEIKVTQHENGTCNVLYQKTHVGHAVGDKTELKHIYLSESQKRKIATKLESGVPLTQIRKQELLSKAQSGSVDRLDLLNNNDIHNIAAKYKINIVNSQQSRPPDALEIASFIEENRDKILFYKCEGEDCTYKKLEKEDFALVIMDETYANYLRLYGDKVIAMGSTRLKSLQNCILHTLMVLDGEEEGLPIAFLISNRNDQAVMDIFVSCIRDRVGVIKTRTLITDMQPTYHDSWSRLMAPPQFFLFCFWSVREAWRQNCMKVAVKEKRASLMWKLLGLAKEANILAFEEKLAAFSATKDADTKPFMEYFEQFFSHNSNCWAYCYRQDAGVNTNVRIKVFHRILKHTFAERQKIETIHQCLVHILECLILKQAEILQKQIKGKITSKLKTIRRRHRAAFLQHKNGDQIEVTPISSSTFLVTSFRDKELDSCTVAKNERKTCTKNPVCNLLCTSCNICYHEFGCSCQDYTINNNMCEHIHWLGLWLQNNLVATENEEIGSIFADDRTNLGAEYEKNVAETDDASSATYWREKVTSRLQRLATDISSMSAEQLEVLYTKFLIKSTPDIGEAKN